MIKSLPLLILTLLTTLSADPIRNLGVVRSKGFLQWDYPDSTNAIFKVYVATTNTPPTNTSSFSLLGPVSQTRWPGLSGKSGLNGPHLIAVTASLATVYTNISGTNITTVTNLDESDFSEVVIMSFRDGMPVPPNNLQLYTVLQFEATNSLPVLKLLDATAPPIPGSELAPSGR